MKEERNRAGCSHVPRPHFKFRNVNVGWGERESGPFDAVQWNPIFVFIYIQVTVCETTISYALSASLRKNALQNTKCRKRCPQTCNAVAEIYKLRGL
jgi:hypothetical protein